MATKEWPHEERIRRLEQRGEELESKSLLNFCGVYERSKAYQSSDACKAGTARTCVDMTLDQAIDKATRQIDAILEQRYRDLEYQMFADGCTDFDGMEEVVLQQRERDAEWRIGVLAHIRTWLQDECGVR